jgi:hypothetical protein
MGDIQDPKIKLVNHYQGHKVKDLFSSLIPTNKLMCSLTIKSTNKTYKQG